MKTQYYCPKCGGVNTDPEVLEGLVRCTSCNEWFKPIQPMTEPMNPVKNTRRFILFMLMIGAAWVFALWRERIAEVEDVGHFEWRVFLFWLGVGLVMALIYFFPANLADRRRHRNANAILILNLFVGWTFIGWVVALIWTIYKPREKKEFGERN
jgi:hypothetical protein